MSGVNYQILTTFRKTALTLLLLGGFLTLFIYFGNFNLLSTYPVSVATIFTKIFHFKVRHYFSYIDLVFSDLIRRKIYARIVPGHTYGPTDRHFAVIEKYCSKVETVYTAHQWYKHVRKAIMSVEFKVEVVEMQ